MNTTKYKVSGLKKSIYLLRTSGDEIFNNLIIIK